VRRATLTSVLRRARDGIRLSEHLPATDGNTIFRHACAMGLEGIVAQRRDRPYRSGRSPDWVKVKSPDAPAATRVIEGDLRSPLTNSDNSSQAHDRRCSP
jgi:bifunctional non-homologous end joining protein LigD